MSEENELMIEEYYEDDNIVILYDEDGVENKYKKLDKIVYEGITYVIFIALSEIQSGSGGVDILEVIGYNEENDTDDYAYVDDINIMTAVYELFKEKNKDIFEFDD